jgi:hypothetical protein
MPRRHVRIVGATLIVSLAIAVATVPAGAAAPAAPVSEDTVNPCVWVEPEEPSAGASLNCGGAGGDDGTRTRASAAGAGAPTGPCVWVEPGGPSAGASLDCGG